MAKKQLKMKKSYLVLLAILLIIIVVVGYKKMAVVEEQPEEEAGEGAATTAEGGAAAGAPAEKEAQPLYPDLCYAEGGTPRVKSDGCRAGEKNIGDVPGFKVPYICCVPR